MKNEQILPNDPFNYGYYISKDGRILNLKPNAKVYEIAKIPDKDNYLRVWLISGKHRKIISVHRLVAMIWCDGYASDLVVNHKDGNRRNNSWDNLEWITAADNERHARKVLGKRCLGEKAASSKLTDAQALIIKDRLKKGETYLGLSKEYNVSKSSIGRIRSGTTYSHLWKKD